MVIKKASRKEGLLSFYIVTYTTLQTFLQECFLVRFVCFINFMLRKNRLHFYWRQILPNKFYRIAINW